MDEAPDHRIGSELLTLKRVSYWNMGKFMARAGFCALKKYPMIPPVIGVNAVRTLSNPCFPGPFGFVQVLEDSGMIGRILVGAEEHVWRVVDAVVFVLPHDIASDSHFAQLAGSTMVDERIAVR